MPPRHDGLRGNETGLAADRDPPTSANEARRSAHVRKSLGIRNPLCNKAFRVQPMGERTGVSVPAVRLLAVNPEAVLHSRTGRCASRIGVVPAARRDVLIVPWQRSL